MRIGAHVSTAGGISKAIERANSIGAEAVQIFASGPQSWRVKMVTDAEAADYKRKAAESKIDHTFLHGIYLINLAAKTEDHLGKGIDSLVQYMQFGSAIGAKGVIFHIGSHKGAGCDAVLKQVAGAMTTVLEKAPKDTWLIIENCAGMGQHIGAKFSDIGAVMREIGSPQVKVCLDTEHAFAAGYNLADKEAIKKVMDEFDKEIGLNNLVAVHANDSKGDLGWGIDRHENIGEGKIGISGFESIMSHAAFANVPFLLEVPGFEDQGPDKKNVDIMKEIRSRIGVKA